MRDAVRTQAGSDVGVENAKASDDGTISIREQRKADLVFLRETPERLLRIVADRGDAETFPFDHRP
jgi:hypothetical protein